MPDKDKNNSVYDKDIHPLVERIALICKQHDISMFLCVQEKDFVRRTSCVNKVGSKKIGEIFDFNQAWDLDEFLSKVIEKAKKEGHNSKFLKAMGIPEEPF